jgi:alpha-beta hydrolase superfamily lysophospholipase
MDDRECRPEVDIPDCNNMIEYAFTDADGVDVLIRTWRPDGSPVGAVVVVHGASEHSGRYDRFARFLNTAGYVVFAPDHRGHGRTAAATGPGVIGPRALEGILDDLDHVVDQAAAAAGGSVFLFGHSLGSIISLRYAETFPAKLSGVVLSGPVGFMSGLEEMIAQVQGAVGAGADETPVDALSPFNAAFEPARTPYDWLSRDPAEVDAYLADPMCGDKMPLTYGFLLANLQAVRDGIAGLSALRGDLAVLIIAGDRDPVSNFGAQARELGQLLRDGGLGVTERYYPEARHELLNELNRDEVHLDILTWLDSNAPR